MANRFLPGYPKKIGGGVQEAVFDHDGPAAYSNVVVNAGTGDVILNSDLGMPFVGISVADADELSSDGINFVLVEYLPYMSAVVQNGQQVSQIRLRWFVLATNAEVANGVNLSGKSVRVQCRLE